MAVLAVDLERPTLVAKADGIVGGALVVVVDDVGGGRGAAVLVVDGNCMPNFVERAAMSSFGLVENFGWLGMLARVGGGGGGGLLFFSFDLHFEVGVHSSDFDCWAIFFFVS